MSDVPASKQNDQWVEKIITSLDRGKLRKVQNELAPTVAGVNMHSTDETLVRKRLSFILSAHRAELEIALARQFRGTVLTGEGMATLADGIYNFTTPTGINISAATHQGYNYKDRNEDRIAIHPELELAAVIDGVGGDAGQGDAAADCVASGLLDSPEDLAKAQDMIRSLLVSRDVHGGACVMGLRFRMTPDGGRFVDPIFQSGDPRLIVVEDGAIAFETDDDDFVQGLVSAGAITEDQALYHPQRNIVCDYFKARGKNFSQYEPQIVRPGSRWIIVDDGVTCNLTTHEIVQETNGKTPSEAIRALSGILTQRMLQAESIRAITDEERKDRGVYLDGRPSKPKEDNMGVIIADVPLD